MSKLFEVYKCEKCGIMVEVVNPGACAPSCCGEPMKLVSENTVDAAKEKHIPVVEKQAAGYKVTVGSVTHPMEEKHYIQWIEFIAAGISYKKFLKPGEAPEAFFPVTVAPASVRAYCNLHGLWKV
jgi:superoxide reductase